MLLRCYSSWKFSRPGAYGKATKVIWKKTGPCDLGDSMAHWEWSTLGRTVNELEWALNNPPVWVIDSIMHSTSFNKNREFGMLRTRYDSGIFGMLSTTWRESFMNGRFAKTPGEHGEYPLSFQWRTGDGRHPTRGFGFSGGWTIPWNYVCSRRNHKEELTSSATAAYEWQPQAAEKPPRETTNAATQASCQVQSGSTTARDHRIFE